MKLFHQFWSLGSVSGVRRRSREQKKKGNFKKKLLSAFFRHDGSERLSLCG